MKRSDLAVLLFLPLLASCSGTSTSGNVPQSAATDSLSGSRMSAQSGRSPNGSPDLLYIGNVGNNSITVYPSNAQGNTAPLYVIAGSNTGIDNPGQLSEDPQGNLYVANGSLAVPSVKPAILVFGHGANGNVPPIRKIAGPLAVHKIQAMTVDQATGEIYVFEGTAPHTEGRSILARFARNATGNVAPLARAYDLDPAVQLASDSSGTGVIEANQPQDYKDFFWGTSTYPAQFRNDSSPTAIYYVLAFFSRGIADDASTRTYLTSGEASFARCTRPFCGDTISGIYRFAEDTTGNFSYNGFPSSLTPPVLSIITSDTCGTQLAVAPGSSPNTYVPHSIKFGSCPTDGVYVYASNASGNAAPLRVLSGSATQLNEPYGIYEGK